MKQTARILMVVSIVLSLLTLAAYGQQGGKKEYAFKGKVEKVDPNGKTLTVNNENIPGWMNSMTMTYAVDKPDTVKNVKTGDQITAKVYEGDFKTLYDVKVVPPAAPKK